MIVQTVSEYIVDCIYLAQGYVIFDGGFQGEIVNAFDDEGEDILDVLDIDEDIEDEVRSIVVKVNNVFIDIDLFKHEESYLQ